MREQRWSSWHCSTTAECLALSVVTASGTYDDRDGEHLRVTVTLATGIPEEVVRSVNLDYLDPSGIDPEQWAADPDTLVVPDAGEDLYRLAL